MLKKIILFCFIIIIFLSILLNNLSLISKDIRNNRDINTLFIIKGCEKLYPNSLRLVLIQYCPKNRNLKVLFIDDIITILQKKKKSKTLNEMFYSQDEDKQTEFIINEIELILDNKLNIDYYVATNLENLYSFIKLFYEKKIRQQLGSDYFENCISNKDYMTSISYKVKLIKYLINNLNRYVMIDIAKLLRSNDILLKTNFKLIDCPLLYTKIKNVKINIIQFADIPTLSKRNRIEIYQVGLGKIIDFLTKDINDTNIKQDKTKVEVFNSSEKNRMAIKVVDKLRNNNFDIFEWGTSPQKYKFTIILDLIGNLKESMKIVGILNCGDIVFRPTSKSFVDISVLLGKDCIIYDKLDRIDKSY